MSATQQLIVADASRMGLNRRLLEQILVAFTGLILCQKRLNGLLKDRIQHEAICV
jgi:hypothetical protein